MPSAKAEFDEHVYVGKSITRDDQFLSHIPVVISIYIFLDVDTSHIQLLSGTSCILQYMATTNLCVALVKVEII